MHNTKEKLIDLLMDLPVTRLTYEEMEKYSEDVAEYLIANDVAPVVRCRDCKHYMTIHCTCDGCCISDDWYCADGERK